MKIKNQNKLITAAILIVIGVLFLALKGGVISIAMTVFGALLIIQAVLSALEKDYTTTIIKGAMGIGVIIFGWAFVKIALYILAGVLLVYGVLQLIDAIKALPTLKNTTAKVVEFIQPAVFIVIAVSLLFNQGGTVSFAFILAGIFLIVQGVLSLIDAISTK